MVHIPKNAGTSIEICLGMEESGHGDWEHYAEKFPSEWEEYRSFSVLRDPVDRFVSSYNYATMENSYWHSTDPSIDSEYGKHIDYDTCSKYDINELIAPWLAGDIELQHPSWCHQYTWIMKDNLVAVDYLASFKNIADAISILVPSVKLDKINSSTSKRSDRLTDENKKLIEKYYDFDCDLYSQLNGHSLFTV